MREDMHHLNQALHRMNEAKNKPSFLPPSIQRLIEEPPSRLAVDPGAMVMACALRAGQAAQAEGRIEMAAEIFRVVLSKDREHLYTYYVAQAKLGLAAMQSMIGQALERPAQIMKVSAH